MEVIISILIGFFAVFFIVSLIITLETYIFKWDDYKKYYQELDKHSFTKGRWPNLWEKHRIFESEDMSFQFHMDGKSSICLPNDEYIHGNTFLKVMNWVNWYWHNKYMNWLEENHPEAFEEEY